MTSRLPVWVEEAGGLRFECTRCTHCCHGPGDVHFAPGEVARIAAYLKLDEAIFRARYIPSPKADRMHIRNGDPCPFLVGNACSIQEVKPVQCRAWPFFPEMLETRMHWLLAGQGCPGIDRGRMHSLDEIAEWTERVGPMPD
ncbi:MAG: YkgJ family cysteine cluster protein [Myxococcota bacterium]